MPRFMTLYKFKPENFRLACERWTSMANEDAPPEIKEAASKLDIETMEFAGGNNFIMAVWNIKDEDMHHAQTLALWLGDAFTLETYPVLPVDVHGKAFEQFMKAIGGKL